MNHPEGNRLLQALSYECRERLLSAAKLTEIPIRTPLFEEGEILRFGHFLTSGLVSEVVAVPEGDSAEVSMISTEGLVGAAQLLGPGKPLNRAMMQLSGAGYRVPMQHLRRMFRESEEFRSRVLENVQAQDAMVKQVAACNRLHEAEARLSRWLLMARDRNGGDVLHLTQEFMADMLGTRRTTVALFAGVLQRSGLIEYRRGKVRIVNPEGLEEAACGCYPIIQQTMKELYSQAVTFPRDGH